MKNIQIVNKLVARELNLDEDLIEKVNGFFWKEIRQKLSSLSDTSIAIKHIGTITVSKRKIDHFIRKTINKIRNIRKSSRYKESTKALLLEFNYDRLKKALKQRNILATQYNENYIKRISRIREAASNNSKECRQDSGSNIQPGETRVESAPRDGTAGDSEKTPNLLDMSV
jgi:hypothetical protein